MVLDPQRSEPSGETRARVVQRGCRAILLPLGCATLLAAPPGATASTVTLRADPDQQYSRDTLLYHASPGEANDVSASFSYVTVGSSETGAWTITDAGAGIVAAAPCRSADAHTVTCVASEDRYIDFARFELGDLDDRFHSEDPSERNFGSVIAYGGPGDDTLAAENNLNALYGDDGNDSLSAALAVDAEDNLLKGGHGDDRLTGGPKSDRLDGGGGRDQLFGGDGEDFLGDGDRDGAAGDLGPGPDLIDGGPGECCLIDGGDRVIYADRTAPLRVDLADREPDGEAGEGDTLIGVESVHAGSGNDRLSGNDQDNTFYGGAGRDRIFGHGGADMLRPGPGGGAISCGTGLDWVEARSEDHLDGDCESLEGARLGMFRVLAYPTTRGSGELGYRLSCPDRDEEDDGPGIERCTATVQIRERGGGGRLLAEGFLPAGRWEEHVITLRVTALGTRLASRRRGVRAMVRLAYRYRSGTQTFSPSMRWGMQFTRDDRAG